MKIVASFPAIVVMIEGAEIKNDVATKDKRQETERSRRDATLKIGLNPGAGRRASTWLIVNHQPVFCAYM